MQDLKGKVIGTKWLCWVCGKESKTHTPAEEAICKAKFEEYKKKRWPQ